MNDRFTYRDEVPTSMPPQGDNGASGEDKDAAVSWPSNVPLEDVDEPELAGFAASMGYGAHEMSSNPMMSGPDAEVTFLITPEVEAALDALDEEDGDVFPATAEEFRGVVDAYLRQRASDFRELARIEDLKGAASMVLIRHLRVMASNFDQEAFNIARMPVASD